MYIVLVTYTQGIDKIDEVLVPHRNFLQTLYDAGILLASGPQDPRTGGVLIAKGGIGKAELAKKLEADPFHTHGLATYEIIAFDPVKHAPVLAGHLSL
ncbi:MAG: GTP cyclohydrolase [Proteobacteria bacterium]|nr:GTP cyclohydrolase [Pseudomonadota bacterium]